MAKSDFESRRAFLKGLAALLGCQQMGAEVLASQTGKRPVQRAPRKSGQAATKSSARGYKISGWTGDDFSTGHRFRAGDFPCFPESAENILDFVIVGGGVSGLTAAYRLRNENFLLLEQYGDFGGNSRGSAHRGIDYSYGAAYVGPVDGIYGQLYSELALEPVELPPERNEFYFRGEWNSGVAGKGKPVYSEFARLLESARPVWKEIPDDSDPALMIAGDLQRLDSIPFISVLNGYSKEFLSLLDSFCRSSLGGGIEQISALSGYALCSDLVASTHVFKGGNPAIARSLAARINSAGAGRCLKNAFVWKIEIAEGKATVFYTLADGSAHRVDCRHVIVATPPMVAARQMIHIPDQLKALLFSQRYCAYLVVNILMREKVFAGSYDCFTGAPFSFADITVAEQPYILTGTYKKQMGSVLTIYQPYSNGNEGRAVLMSGDRAEIAASVVGQMEKLAPGTIDKSEEIVLSRWGHAFAVCGPAYFSRLAKIQSAQSDTRFSLAHSCSYGFPSAESAIKAGSMAAERAKKLSANPGFVAQ